MNVYKNCTACQPSLVRGPPVSFVRRRLGPLGVVASSGLVAPDRPGHQRSGGQRSGGGRRPGRAVTLYEERNSVLLWSFLYAVVCTIMLEVELYDTELNTCSYKGDGRTPPLSVAANGCPDSHYLPPQVPQPLFEFSNGFSYFNLSAASPHKVVPNFGKVRWSNFIQG